jgi:hypothetical protein
VEASFKATPHKEHLAILHVICLHIFRHLAQKSDGASDAQSLCGVAFILLDIRLEL